MHPSRVCRESARSGPFQRFNEGGPVRLAAISRTSEERMGKFALPIGDCPPEISVFANTPLLAASRR
jgi:hypothetical protein